MLLIVVEMLNPTRLLHIYNGGLLFSFVRKKVLDIPVVRLLMLINVIGQRDYDVGDLMFL